jgi:hypothetical protein
VAYFLNFCDADNDEEFQWIDCLKTKQKRDKEIEKITEAVEWIIERNAPFSDLVQSPYLYSNLLLINEALKSMRIKDHAVVADPVTIFEHLDKNESLTRHEQLNKSQLKSLFIQSAQKGFSLDEEIEKQMEENRQANIARHQVYRKKRVQEDSHPPLLPPGCLHLAEKFQNLEGKECDEDFSEQRFCIFCL